jgi:hypothetical protein
MDALFGMFSKFTQDMDAFNLTTTKNFNNMNDKIDVTKL